MHVKCEAVILCNFIIRFEYYQMKTKVKALYSRKTCKNRTPSTVNCWGPLPHCDKLFYTPCGVAYCALADIWIKKMVKHAMWWSKNQNNTLIYIYSITQYLLKWMWRLQNLASYTTIKNKKWRMRAEDRTPKIRSQWTSKQSCRKWMRIAQTVTASVPPSTSVPGGRHTSA